ncbi:MAG TPA: Hsp20/alpha crystallin family protein, partial [Pseudonocardiaceae bacterium]|nr:Hsp20/alpha crystallin family protein [Pseudonocardiaceae bacterium]
MTSVIHRPTTLLPDVFGWLEAGWPFATNSMRVEQYVDDDKYVVRAELPGFDPEKDIQVTVEHGHLVVQAHRTQEEHGRGRTEFHYGAFSRTLPLPAGVASDEIAAT